MIITAASRILFITILLWCLPIGAVEKLKVGVGWIKPPYIVHQGNTGYELDMIKQIFSAMNREIDILYQPHARGYQMLRNGKLDVLLTVNDQVDIGNNGVLSHPYISYRNVAISMKEQNIRLDGIYDLGNYSMIAFQKAETVLGEQFAKAASRSPHYHEMTDQYKQVSMFYQGRADLIIIDLNIFRHISFELFGHRPPVTAQVHKLFATNAYSVGFNNVQLRDKFNLALHQFRHSERQKKLMQKYHMVPVND